MTNGSVLAVVALLLAAGVTVREAGAAGPGGARGNDGHGGRMAFVGILLEESSAARQVQESHNPAAKAQREEARALYQRAQAAQAAGNREQADKLLNEATKTMFAAVRLAEQKQVVAEKERDDFQNRLDSVDALLAAHGRISAEKGAGAANQRLRQTVSTKVAEAKALRDAGRTQEGRKVLDEAYVAAKVAIERLRGGDTLVRSLHFASKADEYRYELDRNDTHKMLVKVLLEEKMKQAGVSRMVQKFLDRAAKLRQEAEQQAAAGRYDTAVRTLEESTGELVRAIRGAGMYIPG